MKWIFLFHIYFLFSFARFDLFGAHILNNFLNFRYLAAKQKSKLTDKLGLNFVTSNVSQIYSLSAVKNFFKNNFLIFFIIFL